MSFSPFVNIPEFAKAAVGAPEGTPTAEQFVDLGKAGNRQRSNPYDGQWVPNVGRIPYLDDHAYAYITFAFSGVEAANVDEATVTIWEWTAGPGGGTAVPVATTELGADGVIQPVRIERSFGAPYAVTVSGLDGTGDLAFNVAVRGEHAPRFGILQPTA